MHQDNHCSVGECPKGAKDEIKLARRASSLKYSRNFNISTFENYLILITWWHQYVFLCRYANDITLEKVLFAFVLFHILTFRS